MSKKKNLTTKEFDQIKLLLQAGLPINKVATLTGRSWTTVQNAKKSNTLKEMRVFQVESRKKYPHQYQPVVKVNTPETKEKALDVLIEIRDLLKEMKDKKTGLFR